MYFILSVSQGSAIKCYSCKDYSGTCSKIRDCYYDDACLSVYERGDIFHVHCVFLKSTKIAKNCHLLIVWTLCLLFVLGGDIHRQCIKYSECDHTTIAQKFPKIASFRFSCCASDLCNTGTMSQASHSVVGILVSLAFFWWCIL